jgi:drug/metabolite transporter (DMT)-like permease
VIAFILAPIVIALGPIPNAHPSIAFLFRPWNVPSLIDLFVMLGLAFVWVGGMYFSARAYSLALASVVAPFEYMTLPISILWGFLLWRQFPTWVTLAGAALTLASSLYSLYQGQKERTEKERQIKEEGLSIITQESAEI